MSDALTPTADRRLLADALATDGPTPRDFFALMKPRVMSLVVFTALIGMVMAPGALNPVLAFTSILLIAIGAGASGALNMWYDADIDSIMRRTKGRPLPRGKMAPSDALNFGVVLSVFSVLFLWLSANVTAALLLAVTIAFYAIVYTMWLKRSTPQNIVIGGAAGAFPPMIGWAVVSDSVTVESLILFAIIFLWTPPHFWALSLYVKLDYSDAGVPMLPVTAGVAATRLQIFIYSLVMASAVMAPALMGMSGLLYMAVAALMTAYFCWQAFRVWRSAPGAERKLFTFSILYLFVIFATLGVDRLAGDLL